MNPNQRTESDLAIQEEAALWAVLLKDGSLSAEDQSAFDQWLAADSKHQGALLRAQAMWQGLDRIGALGVGRNESESSDEVKRSRVRRTLVSVAASVLAVAVGSVVWWFTVQRADVYVSDVGEVRRVRLADGSNMVLNTATQATVRMDESHREIHLVEGEGLFEVAKDPARPFVVHAGTVTIRALGTVFSVRAVDEQVDVTVTEGLVELVDQSKGKRAVRRIAASEHATVTDVRQVQVKPMAKQQAVQRLSWQDGTVSFDGESLLYAVTEMNRHNHRRIVIDDPALANRSVVGLFRASEPETFAVAIAAALGAEAVTGSDVIHLK